MPQEAKVIELKYAAKRFSKMDSVELDLSANKLIIKISIITGWTIPASEFMMNELIEQFGKKMSEPPYQTLNAEEVEYAFRHKGLDLKDWGKSLNLALIDEVLLPYLHNRFDLSRQEEKISGQLPQNSIEDKKEMNDEEWQDWLKDIATYSVNKIPCDSYSYLERKGEIVLTKDQKHEYMERAIAHLAGVLLPETMEGIEFSRMKAVGKYSATVTGSLITISKRLAVFDYFQKKNRDGQI